MDSSLWAGWFREVAVGNTEEWGGRFGMVGGPTKETFHSWTVVLIGAIFGGGRGRRDHCLRLCTLCHRVSGEPLKNAGEGLGHIQWSGNSQNPVAVWLSASREMWAVCFWLLHCYRIRLFFIGSSFVSKKPVLLLLLCTFLGPWPPPPPVPASPLTPSPPYQLLPV